MSFLEKIEIVLATMFIILVILVPAAALCFDKYFPTYQQEGAKLIDHPVYMFYGGIGFFSGLFFLLIRISFFFIKFFKKKEIIYNKKITL
jgi:hypothetical protein